MSCLPVSLSAPLAPPRLASVQWDFDGNHIVVTFNVDTMQGSVPVDSDGDGRMDFANSTHHVGVGQAFNCAQVFEIDLIGPFPQTTCQWKSSSVVHIRTGSVVNASDVLWKLPGTIFRAGGEPLHDAGSMGMSVSPPHYMSAHIEVVGPTTTRTCERGHCGACFPLSLAVNTWYAGAAPRLEWSIVAWHHAGFDPLGIHFFDFRKLDQLRAVLRQASDSNGATLEIPLHVVDMSTNYELQLAVTSSWGQKTTRRVILTIERVVLCHVDCPAYVQASLARLDALANQELLPAVGHDPYFMPGLSSISSGDADESCGDTAQGVAESCARYNHWSTFENVARSLPVAQCSAVGCVSQCARDSDRCLQGLWGASWACTPATQYCQGDFEVPMLWCCPASCVAAGFNVSSAPCSLYSRGVVEVNVFSAGMPTWRDVGQGDLGTCYFLAALASVAYARPWVIKHMFVDEYLWRHDVYRSEWFINGKKAVVSVDNLLPVHMVDGPAAVPAFTNVSDSGLLWPIILEKAWAKIHKTYKMAEAGLFGMAGEAMTGAPSVLWYHPTRTKNETWAMLEAAYSERWPTGASTSQSRYGLAAGHAYSVLWPLEQGGRRFVACYNPWGRDRYNGSQENSDLSDGTFWMTLDEYHDAFLFTEFVQVRDDYRVTSMAVPGNEVNAVQLQVVCERCSPTLVVVSALWPSARTVKPCAELSPDPVLLKAMRGNATVARYTVKQHAWGNRAAVEFYATTGNYTITVGIGLPEGYAMDVLLNVYAWSQAQAELSHAPPASCADSPIDWVGRSNWTCWMYAYDDLCMPSGGYGPNWAPGSSFQDHADPVTGIAADTACCACGGGARGIASTTRPTVVPSTGAASTTGAAVATTEGATATSQAASLMPAATTVAMVEPATSATTATATTTVVAALLTTTTVEATAAQTSAPVAATTTTSTVARAFVATAAPTSTKAVAVTLATGAAAAAATTTQAAASIAATTVEAATVPTSVAVAAAAATSTAIDALAAMATASLTSTAAVEASVAAPAAATTTVASTAESSGGRAALSTTSAATLASATQAAPTTTSTAAPSAAVVPTTAPDKATPQTYSVSQRVDTASSASTAGFAALPLLMAMGAIQLFV